MENNNYFKVKEFMESINMTTNFFKAKVEINKLLKECQASFQPLKSSSIAMYNSMISSNNCFNIKEKNQTLVIDMGGTNCRIIVIENKINEENNSFFSYFKNYPMPGSQGEISKEMFFNQIVEYLLPVIKEHKEIKFCFSYPTKIDKNGEAQLVYQTKEINIKGLVNVPIQSYLKKALKAKGIKEEKIITVLNDTTSTLLSGKLAAIEKNNLEKYDAYLGIVLGTGFNIAYEEKHLFKKSSIINTEIGNYNLLPNSVIDKMIQEHSLDFKKGHLEKKVAGFYLGEIALSILKYSKKCDLLSQETYKIINNIFELNTSEISIFIEKEHFSFQKSSDFSFKDINIIKDIFKLLILRVAFILAIATTSIIFQALNYKSFACKEKSIKKIALSLDGSTLLKTPKLKASYINYLNKILYKKNITFDIFTCKHAPIIGSSLAISSI